MNIKQILILLLLFTDCNSSDYPAKLMFHDSVGQQQEAIFDSHELLKMHLLRVAIDSFSSIDQQLPCDASREVLRAEFNDRLNKIKTINRPLLQKAFRGFCEGIPVAEITYTKLEDMLLKHVPSPESVSWYQDQFEYRDLCNPCKLFKRCLGLLWSYDKKKR